ncbi:type II secretion system secretin GspD [Luteimonas aquatica]|uniref:type II secretion system secretin GspD n=1 Tax=Luteimonas aquatica TaxID=450364 RepID=UPI001F5AE54C|nr:type II secretion system secretin GspD [Luteimonas aquatica]
MNVRSLLVAFLVTVIAGCATGPVPIVRRDNSAPAPVAAGETDRSKEENAPRDIRKEYKEDGGPRPQIRRGSGQTINREVAGSRPPSLGGTTGSATFNFEGESLQAVAKAILGDMLGQNYVIAPGVQGTVTLNTGKPVSPAEALSVLEMVLGWNNARLIYSDGRYNIVPADQAVATGAVAPRTGSAATARGFESRVVPLKYISATEMEKILKPYARAGSIVNVDSGRNVITVAGSRTELENYLRTIQIFDVDWMSSMSVGVFPLQSSKASKVVQDLEKVFGEQSKTPVAGMFRFMPLEGSNSVLVITPQPEYLDQIQVWLERIDGAGEGVQLFSYELKYVKAKDLADRLADVFGGSGGGSGGDEGGAPSLMPGLNPTELKDGGGMDSGGGLGSVSNGGGDSFGGPGGTSGGFGGTGGGGGSLSLNPRQGGNGRVTLQVEGERVGVSAVDETNTLLVRSTGNAWRSIRDVVERLDVMPLQVHIEAQVVDVTLSGDLKWGVSWFLEKGMTDNGFPNFPAPGNTPGTSGPSKWSTLGGTIGGNSAGGGLLWQFVKNDAAAVLSALDKVTDVQVLQTPSVFVRNNAVAELNVGTRIPIVSTSVNPITGSDAAYSQVQYLDTGVILKVRPRVTKDGMVFLDIVQEVSDATETTNAQGNPRISTKKLKSEAAVQDGNTVLMAGLIKDGVTRGSTGLPGLSRIPVLGALFGTQNSKTERTETIVFITPTIVRNAQEANNLTDEYTRRFRAMEPLQPKKKK